MKVQHFLLTGIAVAVLSACGSDNNSKTVPITKIEPAKTITKAANIIDPMHRKDAKCYVDTNENYQVEPSEPSASVDEATGDCSLQVPESVSSKPVRVSVLTAAGRALPLSSIEQDAEVIRFSGVTTMVDHEMWMNYKDELSDAEFAEAKLKVIDAAKETLNLGESVDVNLPFAEIMASPAASVDAKAAAKKVKLSSQALVTLLGKYIDATPESNLDNGLKYVVHGALHASMSEEGIALMEDMKALYEPYVDTMNMKPSAVLDMMHGHLALKPEEKIDLIPLTKAMDAAVKSNTAEYFATSGLTTLGHGDPEGEDHAPSYSVTHYDREDEETHLANYYLKFNHDEYTGYFRSTDEAELEDHFVFDTTARVFKKSYHAWEVTNANFETGAITLVNPWNRFVSRSPISKSYDVSGLSIDDFLSQNPDLKKSWGYLVAKGSTFFEGSKIQRLTVVNDNEVFVLPAINECKAEDGDVKYAILSDSNGEKKLCNFLNKTVEGVVSQARNFSEFFVEEFVSSDNPLNGDVIGIRVASHGNSCITAQLKDATGDSERGNVKFFEGDCDAGAEDRLTLFRTEVPSTWNAQPFGTGNERVDICRVTLPKEVAGYGREHKMHKNAFVVETGEGEDKALRHGKVLAAGMTLPKMPKGLNRTALESIVDQIDLERYKHHEHKEFHLHPACHKGNSLMKDAANKVAYSETLKTRDQYHEVAKKCKTHGETVSTIADFSGKEFTLSKYDSDPYRKIKFDTADGNSGTAMVFKYTNSEVPYEYPATYTFHPENSSVKITFTNPETGKVNHIYYTLLKRIENEDGEVHKCHFKVLHILDLETKGVVSSPTLFVEDIIEE
ncbi:hypothetical protein SOPP22_02065 [Shewanella sp. OPT22]|nr:hypothetical protein SOPP22_02065 [Shewanella sp. OPT22]